MDKEIKRYIDETAKKVLASITPVTNKTGYKNCYKQTEARLYAYPVLQENIKRYEQDIKDLEREKITCRSKDLARFSACATGIRLTPEEIQEGKIIGMQIKLERDQKEVNELNAALEDIESDDYYIVIKERYFDGINDTIIANKIPCDERTVRRNRARLIKKISIRLYGAEAL
ncbi:MAG: hypothetical protein RR413_07625 [Christensenellaceae bacterium]